MTPVAKYRRWALRAASAVLIIYVAVVGFAWAFQRDMLYRARKGYESPAQAGLTNVSEVNLTSEDGTRLMAWYSAAPQGAPTIIYFHGNGGAIHRFKGLMRRIQKAGYGAVFLSYRGYPGSDGLPTEEGLYADGRTAIAWLATQGVTAEEIFLYGHSLGTGVAVKLASERNVGGVILEAPGMRLPYLPVTWLMSDRFESLSRIKEIHSPIFIMHGGSDGAVPQTMGRALFEAANDPKVGFFPDDADHLDLHLHGGWDEVVKFVEVYRFKTTAQRTP
jgi:fermentation-respiration switch protein FrsA (DUF1100 family)